MIDSLADMLAGAAQKALNLLRSVGQRILVHLGAIAFTAVLEAACGGLDWLQWLSSYIGLICLFPRGKMREPSWHIPTVLGIARGLLLAVLGFPWPQIPFWAGLQTWLQRLWQSGGKLGWEWTVSPMLAFCLICFLEEYAALPGLLWPLCSACQPKAASSA